MNELNSSWHQRCADPQSGMRHRFNPAAQGKMTNDRRGEIWEAAAILLVTALHIAYYLLCLRRGHIDPGVDGEVYRQLAREYLASDSLLGEKCKILFWTPWYVFIALTGANQSGVFVFQLGAFVLTLVAIRGLAQNLGFSGTWRVLAILGYGLYWPTFDYVIFYQYENFLSWGVATTAWFMSHERTTLRLRWQNWLVAGVVVGLSVFAHSRAAGLLVLCAALLTALSIHSRQALLRHHLAFWTPALAPLLLWGVRNRLLWGKWIWSSTSFGYNFYVGFNPVATGSFMPQPPYPPLDKAGALALDFIRTHPGRALELVLWKLIRYWEISEVGQFGPWWLLWQEWLLMPLGLVGFALAGYRVAKLVISHRTIVFEQSAHAALFSLVWIITYFQIFHAIFYVFTPRFRLPAMPLIVLAGLWLLHEAWLESLRINRKVTAASTAA
jgi:hypothetical protein